MWDLNLKTGKVFRSRRWKEMLGYTEHEITDSVDEWTTHVHPDDRELSDRELEKHLKGESPVYVRAPHPVQGRIVQVDSRPRQGDPVG